MAARGTQLTGAADEDRVSDVYCDVVELPPRERAAAARRLCGGDAALLREVLRLLPHADPATGFLRPPEEVVRRDPSAELGRVVGGRWRLDRLLGEGATGFVYEAHDAETGRRAAVKLVYGLSDESIRGVRREIALLRWLRLPGVVQLIDDGAEEGAVFCVMEIVDGAGFPGAPIPMTWTSLEPVALGLLEAVASVHAAGVVHCDLKPANVLVDARGAITILDLGISAETRAPFVREPGIYSGGTEDYAAPEQLRGATPEPRWDIYSIGVMLFQALTNEYPGADVVRECARLPAPLHVRRVIASMLAARRSDRPPTIGAVLRVLRPAPHRKSRRVPWTDAELRERFAGPDLLLHLREDAAAEVLRRTGGRPREVEHEIGAWIRSGLAHEERGLVVIDRPALERLRTQAGEDPLDRDFASSLRRGDAAQVARTSLRVASRRTAQGRMSAAMSVLFEGASAARTCGDARLEMRVLRAAAFAAVRTATSSELDRALLLLQRATVDRADVRDLETVIRAALHFFSGRPRDAMSALTAVCQRCGQRDALRIAWSVRNTVARALGVAEERAAVRGIRQWIRRTRPGGATGILATAEGWLRYREGDFRAAVRLHLRAAAVASDPYARNRCLLDAATAAIECRPDEARALAVRARRLSATLRSAVHEGRAVQIERSAILRTGVSVAPNRQFVDAASRVGFPGLVANAAMTEATLAWQSGDVELTRALGLTAAMAWGAVPPRSLARALAAAAGEPFDDATLSDCRSAAERDLPSAVGMQVLALLALARPAWRPQLRRSYSRLRLPRADRDRRRIREVMSVEAARATIFG